MSLWKIAWRSIQQRGLASALTAASMALGVMLVVAVLAVHGVIEKSFRNNASLGYSMIVGAKGGKLQLTLNTVYYLSSPVENVPFEYYMEFLPRLQRDEWSKYALKTVADDQRKQADELQSQLVTAADPLGLSGLVGAIADEAQTHTARRLLDGGRDGKFSQFATLVIPVCLGDYYGNFRVIGTTPAMFDSLKFGESGDRTYTFAAGRNFRHFDDEHGYFEAVVGATVAQEKNIKVGDEISPAHGAPDGHTHARKFTVVGILNSTGNPNDRGVFVNMEGFYLMEDHAKPVERGADEEELTEAERDEKVRKAMMAARARDKKIEAQKITPLPVEQREVTALLVRPINAIVASGLSNMIDEGPVAQAVSPIEQIHDLFDNFIRPYQQLLLLITMVICLVSAVSIMVSIYNSMSDRKRDIAVMRALGAGRQTVMTIILLESVVLALAGGVAGWAGGHVGVAALGPMIEEKTGVSLGLFSISPAINLLETLGVASPVDLPISPELLLVPGLILLAVFAGFLPAMSAYKTDVAKSLTS